MREMDILMGRFLEHGYDAMDDAGRLAFERLLDLPDQQILGWLWGGAGEGPPPDLEMVVDRIRGVMEIR